MLMTDLLDRTVSRYPERRAIADSEKSYTFTQLRRLARITAARIPQQEKTPVGVVAHRCAETAALFMGVLYSGNAYLPLDPDWPAEKLRSVLEETHVGLVLSCREEAHEGSARWLTVDLAQEQEPPVPLPLPDADRPLYYVSTSGSTGKPKCICKTHYAMGAFLEAYLGTFSFDENTVIGNQTPFCFDASAKDLYLMAACGACLEILPTELFSMPVRLITYMDQRRVNFISWVPSALSIVSKLNTFTEIVPQYLNRVFFVGEVFPVRQFLKWKKALPQAEFVNLYGSSEICGVACVCPITEEPSEALGLPLGRPLPGCRVCLVDQGRVITEPGVPGEIWIASDALALGYYGDPERTERQFTVTDLGGGPRRWYHSGDIARYDGEGLLYFSAREDYQIKRMGHRIELGEIETAAQSLEGIESCCCLYRTARQQIVLYCVPQKGSDLTEARVMTGLRCRIPGYMVPQRVVFLEEFPVNANGKIDRAAMSAALNKK